MIAMDMYIEDLIRDYPELVRPLADEGQVCSRCGEPIWGILEELAQSKNIQNLENIISTLNETILNKRTIS